ncbi:hypothetical protein ACS8E9_09470 [Pseudomonas neustonica]|uniref:hypothetical protein n=1 Tax=Pseudomonas neustonica TaxID=2487346 RepID=UPI003F45686F
MTTKVKSYARYRKGALTSFFTTQTNEQKRSVYLSVLDKAKAEQREVSEKARMMRAAG